MKAAARSAVSSTHALRSIHLAALAAALLASACVTLAPPDLVAARGACTTAADGPDAKLSPTALYEAQKVLAQADHELALNGDTPVLHDLVYVTMRKLELADAIARLEQDRQRLASAKVALAAAKEATLRRGDEALAREKQARVVAEGRLAAAISALGPSLKEEPRGLVLSLPGSVLFASSDAKLLDTARARLDQVAAALVEQGPERRTIIEGHTDGKGAEAANLPLSQARADAVRAYLIGRGVDPARVAAVGVGAKRPLGSDRTSEGRASNRRVEIILNAQGSDAR
jgi:outer membrane protein OmpA-like peptidoglycan-associated protein